jgi:hypothetical protein
VIVSLLGIHVMYFFFSYSIILSLSLSLIYSGSWEATFWENHVKNMSKRVVRMMYIIDKLLMANPTQIDDPLLGFKS